MSELITPFKLTVADETLADLRSRLAQTRWPDRETVSDWSQGAPLDQVKALCDYWARDYDWRRCAIGPLTDPAAHLVEHTLSFCRSALVKTGA